MGSQLKFSNVLYNLLNSEFLSILVVLMVLSLILPRNKKSPDTIPHLSFLSFLSYALRGIFGVPKGPICQFFMEMGSLFTVTYYSSPMLVVSNDYEAIKKMLNSPDEWINRPKNPLVAIRSNGVQDRGILVSSGGVWKETRRYTIKTLAQLGLGKKNNLEYMVNEELKSLLEVTENMIQKTNNVVPIRGFFALPTINIIWRIAGGNRFSVDDPEFIEIVEASDNITEVNFYQLFLADIIGHSIMSAVPDIIKLKKPISSQGTMKRHFTNVLERRLEALKNENDGNDENFTDHFLRKIKSNQKSGNTKLDSAFNIDNLIVTLYDLFEAGVDTTSSTLEFAVMFISTHLDVQEKIRNEIRDVIGDKEPSFYTNKINMPYTQAAISEVHRMASIVPLNFRCATRDCYINGTFIKKGTGAVVNQYSIHYDEKFWVDPYNFRPERFLTNEGQLDDSKLRRLLNFGAGKRYCIGESVASISVFTFLVGILQKYELQKAIPDEVVGMEINSSFTSRAKPFHVRFAQIDSKNSV